MLFEKGGKGEHVGKSCRDSDLADRMLGFAQKPFCVVQTKESEILFGRDAFLSCEKVIQISVRNIHGGGNFKDGYISVKMEIHIAFCLLNVSIGMGSLLTVVQREQIEKG